MCNLFFGCFVGFGNGKLEEEEEEVEEVNGVRESEPCRVGVLIHGAQFVLERGRLLFSTICVH